MGNGEKSQEAFLRVLKEEWKTLWRERYDDRVRAEGVATRDYPHVLVERGYVVFAVRDAKSPSFSDIVAYWAKRGTVYAPDPSTGGWGKFIRSHRTRRAFSTNADFKKKHTSCAQQPRKGGRGWLHQ